MFDMRLMNNISIYTILTSFYLLLSIFRGVNATDEVIQGSSNNTQHDNHIVRKRKTRNEKRLLNNTVQSPQIIISDSQIRQRDKNEYRYIVKYKKNVSIPRIYPSNTVNQTKNVIKKIEWLNAEVITLESGQNVESLQEEVFVDYVEKGMIRYLSHLISIRFFFHNFMT